ncbi:hypothetical protein, partial [Halomonas maura]|uniref:hypothetical protein n=1 Tax=Halomonas maura TaxID=117606 RepID=UPI0025B48E41
MGNPTALTSGRCRLRLLVAQLATQNFPERDGALGNPTALPSGRCRLRLLVAQLATQNFPERDG